MQLKKSMTRLKKKRSIVHMTGNLGGDATNSNNLHVIVVFGLQPSMFVKQNHSTQSTYTACAWHIWILNHFWC